jgi:hypothetical protein
MADDSAGEAFAGAIAAPASPVSPAPSDARDAASPPNTQPPSAVRAPDSDIVQGAPTPDSANPSPDINVHTGIPKLDRIVRARISEMSADDPEATARTILASTLQRAPTAMFVMLPAFALLLAVFYLRSRRFYVEHFVFSLHFHTVAFALFTVMLVLQKTFVPVVLGVWLLLYLPIALKRAYGQGWLAAVIKAAVISFSYSIVLALASAATLVVAVLLA